MKDNKIKLKTEASSYFKLSFIPYILCTLWFILDPSLNLKKMVFAFEDQASKEFLQTLALEHSIKGYVLSLLVITLSCIIIKKYGWRPMKYWFIGIVILFFLLPNYTEFPTLGQISLVWSKNPIRYEGEIIRYGLLLTWLIAWVITLTITLIIAVWRWEVKKRQIEANQ